MAVIVVSGPSANTAAYNPIIWKFQLSALGTPPVEKRLRYYLADGSGVQISDTYIWTPRSQPEILTFDASQIIRAKLKTAWPGCAVGMTSDSMLSMNFQVKYSEVDYDTSDCSETAAAYVATSNITAWNSALSAETKTTFNFPVGSKTGAVLNSFPDVLYLSIDSEPYMWFAGVGSATLTFKSQAGSTIGSPITWNFTGADTAKYVSLDWRCHSIAQPHSAILFINEHNSEGNERTFTIAYSVCSCKENYSALTFLDPLGGRSSVGIICPTEISQIRAVNEVYQYSGDQVIEYQKGRSSFRPISSEQVKITVPLGNTYKDMIYARAILGSPGHHLLRIDGAGTKTWHKFLLSAGTIKTLEGANDILLELTGQISEQKTGQQIDI